MRAILFIVLVFLILPSCTAQKLDIPEGVSKKAVKSYEKGMEALKGREPNEAIKHFSKALERDPDFIQARIMRGSVHYNLKDYESAEPDFEIVINSGQEFPSKVFYTAGFVAWRQDKYDNAAEYFATYLTYDDQDERLRSKAQDLKEKSEFAAKAVANPQPFNPESVGDKINTDANEYLPSITADGNTMFFTRRVGSYEFLYFSHRVDGEWTEPRSMEIINRYMESGAHSISADGKLIVFTSCERDDGYGSCDLYYTLQRNGKWIPPRNLGPYVNSAAWDSQPTLADNGRTLYFASNRQGTLGQKDLWVTRRLPSGQWAKPINLGPDINTSGDEKAPYIHFDGSSLYFMSNEHPGMGDFDLFKTTRISDTSWTEPINVGYPINTKFHDGTLSINIQGNKGYITSDRHHQKDLRKDVLARSETDIYVFDIPADIQPNPSTYVVFRVKDQDSERPLVARIDVIDSTENAIFKGQTDEDGEMLVVLPLGNEYGIQVFSEGYAFFSERIEIDKTYSIQKPFIYDIELWPPEKMEDEPIVLKNILFESGSDQLQRSSEKEIVYLYELLKENPAIFIEIRGHTDDVGNPEDNLELSTARARRVKKALVDKGIDPVRIEAKGFGETKPIADNETEDGRQLNRRTEFVIKKQ